MCPNNTIVSTTDVVWRNLRVHKVAIRRNDEKRIEVMQYSSYLLVLFFLTSEKQ